MTRLRAVLARVPPPLLFVLPLAAGMWLDGRISTPSRPGPLATVRGALGWTLAVSGVAVAVSCVATFVRRRTTIVPHRRARSLVTTGAFRISRNPMYVASICLYLGVSVIGNALWPLILLPIPLAFLRAITIPVEERTLAEAFGAEYLAYASRVRRWL